MKLPDNIILKQMLLGPLDNFLYFLGDANTKEIAVIDPAWDVDFLCQEAEKEDYKITNIFLTHGHPDHVNGLDEMLDKHDVPAYISSQEADFLLPKHKNIQLINDKDKLKVGNTEFECILTPGHTPGCISFKHKNILICGDAVFIDGCGRCDLPGGDASVMYDTLYDIILNLPNETVLFPGHNYGPTPFATLESQKKTNPYLQKANKQDFLQQRMGLSL